MAQKILRAWSVTCLLCLLIAVNLAGCSFSITGFNYSGLTAEKSEDGLFAKEITHVEIFNEFGDVTVDTVSDQPTWTWDATVWADTQDMADTYLSELNIDVQTAASKQTFRVVLPESRSLLNGIKSNLTFALPAGVSVTLHNRHGNVSVADTQSDVNVSNAHGNLQASNFLNGVFNAAHGSAEIRSGRSAIVHCSHGGATVQKIAGDVNIECHHGGLLVEEVAGDAQIGSYHGGVSALELNGNSTINTRHGSATIVTSGKETFVNSAHGGVKLTSLTDSFDNIDIVNRHGSIKVTLPDSTDTQINMNASHGNTSSEIAAAKSTRKVNLENAHGNIKIYASKKTVLAEAVE